MCNRGYRNVKPRKSSPVPPLRPGDHHVLRAEMDGEEMTVSVDGRAVWEGSVGSDALAFDGPVGIRSDNARLQLALRIDETDQSRASKSPGCRNGPESE
jgi:hypothetical protein